MTSADPLAGQQSSSDLKFWPLADEVCSDEEEEDIQAEGQLCRRLELARWGLTCLRVMLRWSFPSLLV